MYHSWGCAVPVGWKTASECVLGTKNPDRFLSTSLVSISISSMVKAPRWEYVERLVWAVLGFH